MRHDLFFKVSFELWNCEFLLQIPAILFFLTEGWRTCKSLSSLLYHLSDRFATRAFQSYHRAGIVSGLQILWRFLHCHGLLNLRRHRSHFCTRHMHLLSVLTTFPEYVRQCYYQEKCFVLLHIVSKTVCTFVRVISAFSAFLSLSARSFISDS